MKYIKWYQMTSQNVAESIFIAAMNRVKKEMFRANIKFSNNTIEYILFIMQVVEEYDYLTGPEKKELCIRIARFFDFAFVSLFDDEFIASIIQSTIAVSKGQYKLNKKHASIWRRLLCIARP